MSVFRISSDDTGWVLLLKRIIRIAFYIISFASMCLILMILSYKVLYI